jgi:MYXO-CTERM domain-containing protein
LVHGAIFGESSTKLELDFDRSRWPSTPKMFWFGPAESSSRRTPESSLCRSSTAYDDGMRISKLAGAVALIVPLSACYQFGELDNLGFILDVADPLFEFASGDRMLAGTHMCPELGFVNFGVDEGHLIDPSNVHCFSETLTGPAQFDAEHCLTLDTPGTVTWELTPTDLADCEPNYTGDRMVMEVVAASNDLRLGFDDWRVRAPFAYSEADVPQTVVGLTPGRTLADLREDPNAARRVFAGQLDTPMLRLDDDLGQVYFADPDVVFEVIGEGATAVEPIPPVDPEEFSSESRYPGEQPLVLEPDAVARVRATLPGNLVFESPELIAVPASDAASLELLVMLVDGGPVYAYAEVRDAQDRVLHGAPIEWGVVDGALGVAPGDLTSEVRTGEYALLDSGCEPPSETEPLERHAILRARVGALEDTVELTWIEEPEQPNDLFPFEPGESCMFGGDDETGDGDTGGNDEIGEAGDEDPGVDDGGCACSSEGNQPAPTGPAWLALAALLFVRRRSDLRN